MLRLCGVIHVIERALEILKLTFDANKSDCIEERLKQKLIPTDISLDTVLKACEANRYFILQKMYLSGYELCDEYFDGMSMTIEETNEPASLLTIEARILSTPGNVLYATDLIRGKTCLDVKSFTDACENLQANNLGKVIELKRIQKDINGNVTRSRKHSKAFQKHDYEQLEQGEQLVFINSLAKFKISLDTYVKFLLPNIPTTLDDTQNKQALYSQMKRSASRPLEPIDNKKIHGLPIDGNDEANDESQSSLKGICNQKETSINDVTTDANKFKDD